MTLTPCDEAPVSTDDYDATSGRRIVDSIVEEREEEVEEEGGRDSKTSNVESVEKSVRSVENALQSENTQLTPLCTVSNIVVEPNTVNVSVASLVFTNDSNNNQSNKDVSNYARSRKTGDKTVNDVSRSDVHTISNSLEQSQDQEEKILEKMSASYGQLQPNTQTPSEEEILLMVVGVMVVFGCFLIVHA